MPLVVPILRLCMLFLNVYETYKTLKIPPLSARHAGRPSVRASTQRKRNMKGCLAVWIVWCCFAAYDRTLDGIVKLFVPFYDELKSLVILFFILTRSRGAEPVYLHVIRPLVKPYAGTFDSVLDMTSTVGDVLFILSTFPVRLVLSWWHTLFLHKAKNHEPYLDTSASAIYAVQDADSQPKTSSESVSSHPPQALRQQPSARRALNRNTVVGRHASQSRLSINNPTTNNPPRGSERGQRSTREPVVRTTSRPYVKGSARISKPTAIPHQRLPGRSTSQSVSKSHEIWYPSSSLDGPSEGEGSMPAETAASSGSSAEPNITTPPLEGLPNVDTAAIEIDEWRLYPPFPAAYPPTPLPAASKLPQAPLSNWNSIAHRTSNPITFSPIPEDALAGTQHTLGRMSLPPREPLKRGFNTSSSDADSVFGGQGHRVTNYVSNAPVDHADDEEEEEDEFDVTLRTPMPPIGTSRSRSGTSNVSTAASSVQTRSTNLTTADNGSSMRTRTASESSSSVSISDSASISDSSLMARRRPSNSHFIDTEAMTSVTTVSHQEIFAWKPSIGADDEYDSTSTSVSEESSSSDSDYAVRQQKRRILKQISEHATPRPNKRPRGQQDRVQRAGSTSDLPALKQTSKSVDITQISSRKSARLAGLGAAPAISRRVTAPTSGSMPGGPTNPVAHRHASDRNPTRRK